jgi:uncharacterized spore protein YtfJ
MTDRRALTPTEPEGPAFDAARTAAGSGVAGLLEKVAEQVGMSAGAKAVFGEPVERGDRTVVPVAQVIVGAGAGTGTNDETGSGSGAGSGALSRPIGYIEITNDGAQFVPLRRPWLDGGLIVAVAFSSWLVAKAASKLIRG